MGGGLMQLVAYGAQDVYLSGNPQITFFKVVYRRHTNFSVEPIQQTWNGSADFGRTVTCNINRNGDLITNMYVVVKLNPQTLKGDASNVKWGYVNRLGHVLIEDIKIEIGGSKIDEQYGDWLNIWYELTHKVGQERGYAKMIGDVPELTSIDNSDFAGYQMYIPLQFWFNRNNGLALPLIALQYHDVRVTLKYRDQAQCINYLGATPPKFTVDLMADSYLLIDYVYLDSEERKRFAQASHEYLIEQLQFTGSETITSGSLQKYRLNFNHPSKYLIWAPHLDKYNKLNKNWLAYSTDGTEAGWVAAKDRFAKVLACATSDGLVVNDAGVFSTNASTSYSEGELVSFVTTTRGVNSTISNLLSKVTVKYIAASDSGTGTGTGTSTVYSTAINATGVTGEDILDGFIVTKNDLTMSDISSSWDILKGSDSYGTDVTTFITPLLYNVADLFNYGNNIDGSDNVCVVAKLQLNGHDRFQERDGSYFNYVQPAQHFSNTPADGINVYSFALKAEDHQPTGTCNFSRIDNATLNVTYGTNNGMRDATSTSFTSTGVLNIYTQNYNVLRVMSGMAGTAYSN